MNTYPFSLTQWSAFILRSILIKILLVGPYVGPWKGCHKIVNFFYGRLNDPLHGSL
jgi:hypothetical protein